MITVARVLIDSPLPQLDRLFDYAIPAELDAAAVPGVRVAVPLRSAGRVVEGYLVERGDAVPGDRPLSALEAIVSPVVLMPAALYELARRAAERAAGSTSDVLRLAIPRRMVRAEKAWLAADPPRTPLVAEAAQRWAAGVLAGHPGLAHGLDAGERLAVDAPPRPSVDRPVGAWAELLAAVAVHALQGGRSAVLVVPDHRDLDQVLEALAGRVPDEAVVRDDAARSAPERYRSYLRVLAGEPCVVVGNRSSVYAPAHDVGVVALWDDGDPLLAEPLSPGVHARDAALLRQEQEGSALVFAGHTRTTDVERLVGLGWVREVPAARRETPRIVLPPVGEAGGARVPSTAFAAARDALAHGPVLVQVARPGYAPVLVCAGCRTSAHCAHCGGPLRARRPGVVPECAWCGRPAPGWTCPACASTRLRMASSGSERTADELGRAFPNTRVVVADGEHSVGRVDSRPALVVATRGAEPFAEGGYRAVILLDGDRMLLTEQLRIGESCLRWWSNAAALAAPGAPVHLVGVTGPVARAFATWTQPAYARSQLAERAPLLMPPTVRVAAVEGEADAVRETLEELRAAVPTLAEAAILGPVPAGEAGVRALVRFDYAAGRRVAASLRAAVVARALGRRRVRGARTPRTTLRVRLDVPELDL
ncbi:primosomal protein N' [Microbacterium sp.]|uniref:primosomal protein N' family DNA-binding protein n=1 Tax=Microbacterium sp. TaxID=51671 RepID=UPI0039E52FF4